MFLRLIKRSFRKNREFPYGKCFVSFAYKDEPRIDLLRKSINGKARLFIFPPINVPPEKMVSNNILRTIRRCDSLIYLIGGESSNSPWVAIERDYAIRSGLDVYYFDQHKSVIKKDTSAPLDLPVFASYSHSDDKRVKGLLDFMRRKRSFDIFMDKDMELRPDSNIADTLTHAITSRLKRGGYLALFWSYESSKSKWVEKEMEYAFLTFPKLIMPALLDPINLPFKFEFIEFLPLRA